MKAANGTCYLRSCCPDKDGILVACIWDNELSHQPEFAQVPVTFADWDKQVAVSIACIA